MCQHPRATRQMVHREERMALAALVLRVLELLDEVGDAAAEGDAEEEEGEGTAIPED